MNRKPDRRVDGVSSNEDVTNDNGVAELRRRLRQLHLAAGRPTFRKLHEQASLAGRTLPISTAHELLAGRRRPRWVTVEAFVIAAVAYAHRRRPPADHPDRLGELAVWRRLYERIDGPADPSPDGVRPHPRSTYVGFVLAVDAAHAALGEVARSRANPTARYDAANRVLNDSGVCAQRERLLAAGAPAVVAAGERLFLRLLGIQDAVRAGARADAEEYHAVYHPFAHALWAFRLAVRTELGRPPLTPQTLDRVDWSDHERCANCTQSAT
jgi:hypothetical protein